MGIKLECIKHLFRKPFTRRYPKEEVKPCPRFRGKIKFHSKKCIGCKKCVQACPTRAIKYRGKGKLDFDMGECFFCGLCVDVCPVGAIEFSNEFAYADKDKKKFIVK